MPLWCSRFLFAFHPTQEFPSLGRKQYHHQDSGTVSRAFLKYLRQSINFLILKIPRMLCTLRNVVRRLTWCMCVSLLLKSLMNHFLSLNATFSCCYEVHEQEGGARHKYFVAILWDLGLVCFFLPFAQPLLSLWTTCSSWFRVYVHRHRYELP